MAATDDLARLLVTIEVSQSKIEKQLATIAKKAGDGAKQIDSAYKAANTNIASGFTNTGNKVVRSLGAQQAAAKNLGFQLNDIATQLASGTSPFRILAQQGGQVIQIMNEVGNPVRALGGAFAGLLNPVGLATIAVGALAAAAIAYFTDSSDGTDEANKRLEEHIKLVGGVADKWGDALPALKAYHDELKRAQDASAIEEAGTAAAKETLRPTAEAVEQLRVELAQLVADMNTIGADPSQIVAIQRAFEEFLSAVEDGTATTEQYDAALKLLSSTSNGVVLRSTTDLSDGLKKLEDGFKNAAERASDLKAESKAAADSLKFLQKSILPALGQLSPIFSGGGKFLDPEEFQQFTAKALQAADALDSASAKLIKQFEGFRTGAYWDKNHFRAGFGSDTFVDAAGQIKEVTKDTVVTLDQANADLARRIGEFQDTIMGQIGPDVWRSFSESQQAALTSIAYNYGQLPKSIVAAIQAGGGPESVAQAIAALDANPDRRKIEAQTFLSGTGVSSLDAGTKKTPDEIFQGDLNEIQGRIDLVNAEFNAQSKLNPAINDYGYAVEQAKIKQQLLNEAKKAGVSITPELAAKIDELAANYAKASAGAEQFKDSQQKATQVAQEIAGTAKDVFSGVISDLRAGADAADILSNALDKVADKLIDVGLNALFGVTCH